MSEYCFTEDWLTRHGPIWAEVVRLLGDRPKKILEVGSYEGRSATWFIENALAAMGELYCVDHWEGGWEHAGVDMKAVEERFDANIALATELHPATKTIKIKERALIALSRLIADGHENSFDLIYLDGGHEAEEVLTNLVMCYHLCRTQGLIICDDYLFQWGVHPDQRQIPKTAIDAVVNVLGGKLQPALNAPLYQLFLIKAAPK